MLKILIRTLLILIPPSLVTSMELKKAEEHLPHRVIGVWEHGKEEPVAIQEVSYVISPADDEKQYLCLNKGDLKLQKQIDSQSLFSFSHIAKIPYHYLLNNQAMSVPVSKNEKNKVFIGIASNDNSHFKIQLFLKEHSDDFRPLLLQSDKTKSEASFCSPCALKNDLWTLKPVYEFSGLNAKEMELDCFLIKIGRQEKITSRILSKHNIQALYAHYKPSQPLTIIQEDKDFLYGHTPDLPSAQGVYFMSPDFPLKLYNIENFYVGVGDDSKSAKASCDLYDDTSLELESGKTVFLKPYFKETTPLPAMGLIEITPGQYGWISRKPAYNNVRVKLKELIGKQGKVLFPTFLIECQEGTFRLVTTNPSLSNPIGGTIYTTQAAAEGTINTAGARGLEIADRLAGSVESFGRSIEIASLNAKEALIESTKNLSEAVKFTATTLGSALTLATTTFQNTTKLLCDTVKGLSKDLTANLSAILRSIDRTVSYLSDTLIDVSNNLDSSLRALSDACKESAKSFEKAFGHLSKALRVSTKDINKAIKKASQSFESGMDKIKEAAKDIKDTHHQVDICLIS